MNFTLKEISVKGILTKSNLPIPGFSANPYVGCTHSCKYCYASFMKRFTGHTEPWGSFVDIKFWNEIKHVEKYSGRDIFIASVTDPYQPLEAKYCRTKALLEQLKGSGIRLSISTKSDLILRDLELIKTFPNARVSWSINTLDEEFRGEMDKAVSIERRLKAMETFHEARIRTTCFISPIFPGITDVFAIIKRVRNICNLVWLENLNLRGNYKAEILNWIHVKRPELEKLYHDIYIKNDRSYWSRLDAKMKEFTNENNLIYVRNNDNIVQPFEASPVVVNYFFHEEITHSKRKDKDYECI